MTIDDLLKQGIAALNAGQKAEARNLLLQVIQQDERNEMGWLWLSGAVETDEDRRICLENVVAINPNNSIAQRGLERFQKSSYGLDSTSRVASREAAAVRPIGEARTGVEFQSATDETHEILRQAVAAIRSGEKERGKQLLVQVIEQDEDNELAWLWMTRCVTDRDVKRECLERVLAVNPDNKHAIEGLKRLEVLSKAESPSKRKLTKQQTRLMLGLGGAVLAIACIGIAGTWWAINSGLLSLGSASPVATDITQEPSVADVTSTSVPSPTPIPTWTPTPSPTNTPRPTRTPRPTNTPRPTPTPSLGTFAHPAPIGVALTRSDPLSSIQTPYQMSTTVLEVRKGEEAARLARSQLYSLTFSEPIEGQEYIAVRVKLEVKSGPSNEVYSLYPYWHLTLRYEPSGTDIWSQDVIDMWDKGYPPLGGEGWVFFLARTGSEPLLYFQPNLIVNEQLGYRTLGAFFTLTQP